MKIKSQNVHAGLTLIEVLILVAILGMLAAIAIPAFQSAQARCKEAIAQEILSRSVSNYLSRAELHLPRHLLEPGERVLGVRSSIRGLSGQLRLLTYNRSTSPLTTSIEAKVDEPPIAPINSTQSAQSTERLRLVASVKLSAADELPLKLEPTDCLVLGEGGSKSPPQVYKVQHVTQTTTNAMVVIER